MKMLSLSRRAVRPVAGLRWFTTNNFTEKVPPPPKENPVTKYMQLKGNIEVSPGRCEPYEAAKPPYAAKLSQLTKPADKFRIRNRPNIKEICEDPAETQRKVNAMYSEDGEWIKPNAFDWPYFTYKDVCVNYNIPTRGFIPPNLEAEHFKEIEEKTGITKDNIDWSRYDWIATEPQAVDYDTIAADMVHMHCKGVSKRTVCIYLNYVSNFEIMNWNWTRIDS